MSRALAEGARAVTARQFGVDEHCGCRERLSADGNPGQPALRSRAVAALHAGGAAVRRAMLWAAAMLPAAAPHAAFPQSPHSATAARPAKPVQIPDGASCDAAIQAAEHAKAPPPPGLLAAIGMVESGRADPRTGRAAPWPWTINVAGEGQVFASKTDAIAAVTAAQAAGVQSIDVGCMQVNLMYHPDAFASLEQAFDPPANAAYASAFLGRLFVQLGDWPHAAAAYHSQTPGIGEAYGRRVMAFWPLAAQFGGDALGQPDSVLNPTVLNPAAAAAARRAAIDPNDIYTPAFRARLEQDAADRARRVALGLVPPAAHALPAGRPRTAPLKALAAEPRHAAPTRLARAGS